MDSFNYDSTCFDEIGLLTPQDIAFVHKYVIDAGETLDEVTRRLNHPETRHSVLDTPELFDAIREHRYTLCVSEYFYYWVIVRKVMLEAHLPALVYTENVALSLVKMAFFQREALERDIDLDSRYFPVKLSVLVTDETGGKRIRICSQIEPYQMVMEGFEAGESSESVSSTNIQRP